MKNGMPPYRPWIILAALLAIPPVLEGITIHVPKDHPTIQAAIDAAVDYDTVLVAPGTYVENIDFKGKDIAVRSDDGAEVTVIDGGQVGSVVTFNSGETNNACIEGFTLTNGTGRFDGSSRYSGGGVYCENANPTIRHNRIWSNGAGDFYSSGYGGGIFIGPCTSKLIVDNNEIESNSASSRGGGVSVVDGIARFAGNRVHGNYACYGAGIELDHAEVELEKNLIYDNSAIDINCGYGVGGGVYARGASMTCIENGIYDNWAFAFCGGIYLQDADQATFNSNRILFNEAEWGTGGIEIYDSTVSFVNDLIHGNKGDFYHGINYEGSLMTFCNVTVSGHSNKWYEHAIVSGDASSIQAVNCIFYNCGDGLEIDLSDNPSSTTLDIAYSDVRGGQAGISVDPGSTLTWGAGMIDADPLFVDSTIGDGHLRYDSPCRDVGDATHHLVPDYDRDGNPRPSGAGVDMGMDEFHAHLYMTGDFTPGGAVELKITGIPGTNPVGFWMSADLFSNPMNTPFGDWWLAAPMTGPVILGAMPSPEGVLLLSGTMPSVPSGSCTVYFQALVGSALTLPWTLAVN